MSEHPIESLMSATMQKIREMVDVNTIVGNPIVVSESTTVIPISKVTYGFGSGGSDFASKHSPQEKNLFGGGGGAGITISPVAMLTINRDKINLLQVEPVHSSIDKIIEMAPGFLEKIKELFKRKPENKKTESE